MFLRPFLVPFSTKKANETFGTAPDFMSYRLEIFAQLGKLKKSLIKRKKIILTQPHVHVGLRLLKAHVMRK